jgi:hypothetical protein
MHENELTPAEREAFAALPRERSPGDLLEQWIVRRLRQRGTLGPARVPGIWLRPCWLTGAAAAAVLLIGGSFVLGQWMGSRQGTQVAIALRQEDGRRISAMVQATGSAYVGALEALADAVAREPESAQQGREAALAILRAASRRIASLAPDEPMARRILVALEGVTTSAPKSTPSTVFEWF